MPPLLTTRRSQWLPGVAILGAAVGVSAVLGLSIHTRSWWVFFCLFAGAILVLGQVESFWARRQAARKEPRSRGKLRVIRGGKSEYDLEADERTDNQRYLM